MRAGFEHEDLLEYCNKHPITPVFLSCLRPNASYKMQLQLIHHQQDEDIRQAALNGLVNSLIYRDRYQQLMSWMTTKNYPSFLNLTTAQKNQELDELLKIICELHFYECYIENAERCGPHFPGMNIIFNNKFSIKEKLDNYIAIYLTLKNAKYDNTDINRAARQAACVSDLTVLKLLIYTRRAEINLPSSSNQTPLDYAFQSKCTSKEKEQCIQLLKFLGAKTGLEIAMMQTIKKIILVFSSYQDTKTSLNTLPKEVTAFIRQLYVQLEFNQNPSLFLFFQSESASQHRIDTPENTKEIEATTKLTL